MLKTAMTAVGLRKLPLRLVVSAMAVFSVSDVAWAIDIDESFQKVLLQQARMIEEAAQGLQLQKEMLAKRLPFTPATPVVPERGATSAASARMERPSDIPPIALSKSLKRQTDDQRSATATAIQAEIETLQARLDGLVAVEPKSSKLIEEISQINETLSAKRQAYNFALGIQDNLSNAAAESFAALNNPYFLVCGDTLWAPKDPLKWQAQLEPVKDRLIQVGRSVGLVKIGDSPLGTAFVVRKGFILTNSHVLRMLADYDKTKKVWKVNPTATVTFDAERALGADQNCTTPNPPKTYMINAVYAVPPEAMTVAPDGTVKNDMAVLLVSTDTDFPAALNVSVVPGQKYAGNMVLAVIGYPGPPDDMTASERMEFFSAPNTIVPVFPYKRLSSGFVGEQLADSEGIFAHRANTAGGNSGSPIINLEDASIVGIHVRGRDRFKDVMGLNYGLTSERIRAFLAKSGLVQ